MSSIKHQLGLKLEKTRNKTFKVDALSRANRGVGHYSLKAVEPTSEEQVNKAAWFCKSILGKAITRSEDPLTDFARMVKLMAQSMSKNEVCDALGMSAERYDECLGL